MKYTNKWILALLPATLLASCAEDVFEPYSVDAPASVAELEYLKDYNVLKEYAGTGIKIGAEVDVNTYTQQGALFGLAKTNFHEVSGGTSFMHKALTRDDGGVNLGVLVDFTAAAEAAGQSIFGSALVSNINQNGNYFKTLLADRQDPDRIPEQIEVKKHDDTRCIRVPATAKKEFAWDNQFWFVFEDTPLNGGEEWEYTMDVRADYAASIGTQIHAKASDYIFWAGIDNVPFTTEWTTITKKGTFSTSDQWGDNASKKIQSIALNLSDYAEANNYYFKNVSFKVNGTEVLANGDLSTEETKSFVSKTYGGGMVPSEIVNGYDYTKIEFVPIDVEYTYNKPCVVVTSSDQAATDWDTQFFIVGNQDFKTGDNFEVSMKIRADKKANAEPQFHDGPGGYKASWIFGDKKAVEFTPNWTTFTAKGTVGNLNNGGTANTIALNLNTFDEANKYYFTDISLKINGQEVVTNNDMTEDDNSCFVATEYPSTERVNCTILPNVTYIWSKDTPGIPLTASERKTILTDALNSYIKTIMTTADGKIKSWDVIGDVLSDNGSRIRDVKDDKTEFNWSEDLGKEEFARLAVKYAREHFAAAGGSAADLKLFVNESGLENDAKLQGLLNWISIWEGDNATKFDGISTKIKATAFENADQLKAEQDKIEALLKNLANTGKLIRIAGIDLNYVNAKAEEVITAAMTTEQAKNMGEMYKFIITKYKELVPESQRYGIFVSNITDNGDTPNGLWNSNYSRKPQYGAFADGLK